MGLLLAQRVWLRHRRSENAYIATNYKMVEQEFKGFGG
jgi:hypothetical protein